MSSSLHYCASAAATLLLCVVLNVHLVDAILALRARRRTCVRRHLFVISANLSYDVVEGIVDIDTRFGRRLNELAAKLSCQVLAL